MSSLFLAPTGLCATGGPSPTVQPVFSSLSILATVVLNCYQTMTTTPSNASLAWLLRRDSMSSASSSITTTANNQSSESLSAPSMIASKELNVFCKLFYAGQLCSQIDLKPPDWTLKMMIDYDVKFWGKLKTKMATMTTLTMATTMNSRTLQKDGSVNDDLIRKMVGSALISFLYSSSSVREFQWLSKAPASTFWKEGTIWRMRKTNFGCFKKPFLVHCAKVGWWSPLLPQFHPGWVQDRYRSKIYLSSQQQCSIFLAS